MYYKDDMWWVQLSIAKTFDKYKFIRDYIKSIKWELKSINDMARKSILNDT